VSAKRYEKSPLLSANHADRVKKWRPCLGCGKSIYTDRCHRICRKCRRRNNASPGRAAYGVGLSHSSMPGDALLPRTLD
jgi:hypothetical protein